MTFSGADTDELRGAAATCMDGKESTDQVIAYLRALVIVLKAASFFTGGASKAYAAYLESVVIPWLQKISMALGLFAQVLGANADAQDRTSAGETVDFGSLPRYQTPNIPTTSIPATAPVAITDCFGGAATTPAGPASAAPVAPSVSAGASAFQPGSIGGLPGGLGAGSGSTPIGAGVSLGTGSLGTGSLGTGSLGTGSPGTGGGGTGSLSGASETGYGSGGAIGSASTGSPITGGGSPGGGSADGESTAFGGDPVVRAGSSPTLGGGLPTGAPLGDIAMSPAGAEAAGPVDAPSYGAAAGIAGAAAALGVGGAALANHGADDDGADDDGEPADGPLDTVATTR